MTRSKRNLSHGICRCSWLNALFTRVARAASECRCQRTFQPALSQAQNHISAFIPIQTEAAHVEAVQKGRWSLHWPPPAHTHSVWNQSKQSCYWLHCQLFLSDVFFHQHCSKSYWFFFDIFSQRLNAEQRIQRMSEGALPGGNVSQLLLARALRTALQWGALMLSWALQRKALTHPCCRYWAMAMNVFISLLHVDSCLPGSWEEILLQIGQALQHQHFTVFWSGLSIILSQHRTSQW